MSKMFVAPSVTLFRDFILAFALAIGAGWITSLIAGSVASIPGWAATGVCLGILFADPVGVWRKGGALEIMVIRFSVGVTLGYLIHTVTLHVIEGQETSVMTLGALPLLVAGLLMAPRDNLSKDEPDAAAAG